MLRPDRTISFQRGHDRGDWRCSASNTQCGGLIIRRRRKTVNNLLDRSLTDRLGNQLGGEDSRERWHRDPGGKATHEQLPREGLPGLRPRPSGHRCVATFCVAAEPLLVEPGLIRLPRARIRASKKRKPAAEAGSHFYGGERDSNPPLFPYCPGSYDAIKTLCGLTDLNSHPTD